MASIANPVDRMEELEEEIFVPQEMNEDIPECEGLPRRLWNTMCVTLYNDKGKVVGEGTCHSVNSDLVLGANGPPGDAHVAVHISNTLSEVDISCEQIYSLRAWPIHLVHCRGASLRDHEACDKFNILQAALLNPPSLTSSRPYASTIRNPPRETSLKSKALLTQQSIHAVSSKVCCVRNCVQPFSREKIRAYRERMYHNSTFKHRAFMKTDVHRQIHHDSYGRKMVTVEGIPVCMQAWMHISGVPESTFFRYQTYMKGHQEATDHGNTGLLKPRKHTEQATATLKCIFDKEADHMPHRTHTMKSGEKVVSMCLPSTFQWKGKMKELNDANAAFGLPEVSTSNLSKIRSSRFLDVHYAPFSIFFPHDSNYTIGSVAKLLRDLELPPKSSSREFFGGSRSTNLFKAVLKGAEMCEASLLPPPITLVPATPLPPILKGWRGDPQNHPFALSCESLT